MNYNRGYTYKPRRRVNWLGVSILVLSVLLIILLLVYLLVPKNEPIEEINYDTPVELNVKENPVLYNEPTQYPKKFYFDSGIDIPYPEDGVKGIYMSAYGYASDQLRNTNLALIENSNLNAMVIDVKDDWGTILFDFESDNPLILENTENVLHAKTVLKELEEHQIYPIARVVTFKDSSFAKKHPEHAFKNADGSVWANHSGENFINPFSQEVWDYTIAVAIEAAMAGFKEIQFDYIRFAEGFSFVEPGLTYDMGKYADIDKPIDQLRVQVINDFIEYAKQKLEPYNVHVGIDIFGYTATVPEDSDIGQNFAQMAERGDVVSSMIYPRHWGLSYFGYDAPDTHPYGIVKEYMIQEKEILSALPHPPITRPWLQDFTASYLGPGWYIDYGPTEVKAQVQALKELGINEWLLWNAANVYSHVEGEY